MAISKDKESRIFIVRYIDKRYGKVVEVDIVAQTERDVRVNFSAKGTIIDIKRKKRLFAQKCVLSSAERYVLLSRLSTMISSKVGTGESLRLMRDTFTGKIQKVAGEMLKKIEQGHGIGEAMDQVGHGAFPPGIVALVKAGIRGGDTGRALLDAATFEQELNDIKKESNKGMGSAIFGFLFAGAFLVGSSFYMSPKVKESPIFQEVEIDTSVIDILATVMGWVMLVVMVLFFSLVFLGSVLKRIAPSISDNIILKIPVYRDLVLAKNAYATLYGLSMLVGSGVRIEDSLKITMDNAPKGALRSDVERAWESIRAGDAKWPAKMRTLHATDRAALMTSSNRDQIAKTLMHLSAQSRRLYGERLKLIIPTMQLISAALLSFTGAIMFGQIILPMLKMTQGIG